MSARLPVALLASAACVFPIATSVACPKPCEDGLARNSCTTVHALRSCPTPAPSVQPTEPAPSANVTAQPSPATSPNVERVVVTMTPSPVIVVRQAPAPRPRTVLVPHDVIVTKNVGSVAAPVATGTSLLVVAAAILLFARRRKRVPQETVQREATFVANLSHELYTPLTPMKGYASILTHHDLPPDRVRTVAEDIAHASERLERTIDALVGFAESERGSVDPLQDAVEAATLVEPTDRVRVSSGDGLGSVMLNERLMRLAVRAVVDNAEKFSTKEVRVRITRECSDTGDRLAIEVRDEGIGMSRAQVRSAMQPFTQLDDSPTRRYGGLGIGLALAQRVARLHGGALRVRSKPKSGISVTISIPYVPAGKPAALAATRS